MAALNAVPQPPKEMTLNERLNQIADAFDYQCMRIESVLARVNGTPQGGEVAGKAAKVTSPLGAVVDSLESTSQRLTELCHGIERIA